MVRIDFMKFFDFPTSKEYSAKPVWTGSHFVVDGKELKVLCYDMSSSGWSKDLTDFHEQNAGSSHSIDVASRALCLSMIEKFVIVPTPTILEIGCGSGWMIRDLVRRFPAAQVIGSDYLADILENLAKEVPHVPLLQFDLVNCPLDDNSIDCIVMLNVLEHIKSDQCALSQILRILKPGGIAIFEVPAGPHLFDIYDKVLMHFRRYSMSNFEKLLTKIGFRIKYRNHLGFLLYPAFWFIKKRNQRWLNINDDQKQRSIIAHQIKSSGDNLIVKFLFKIENILRCVFEFPFGIRCVVATQKPST